MFAADHGQHQVERRRASGAGEDAAMGLEQLAGDLDIREFLSERRRGLPVHRDPQAFQKAGLGEDVRASVEGAQHNPRPGELAQDGQGLAAFRAGRLEAGADDQGRRPLGAERRVDHDAHGVGRFHRLRVLGIDAPAIERPPREPVGDAQRFQRRKEGHSGKARDQQEADHLGVRAWLHASLPLVSVG